MLDTMSRYLVGVSDRRSHSALRRILRPLVDRMSTQALTSAGLVINAGGALFPKIGATDFYAVVQGKLVKLAAGTALPAPSGVTAGNNAFNVAVYVVDGAGTVTALPGTAGAAIGTVGWPQLPDGKAVVGFLIVTNASGFTGGTTALDAGTTVYLSPIGPSDPTMLV